MEKIKSSGQLLPAYPLFIKDPFFSIWSTTDKLNESETTFWTGMRRRTYGLVHCDGQTYCFMGVAERTKRLEQTSVEITAFSTVYNFTCEKFDLKVSFISPLPLRELDIMACPVCYMTYTVTPKQKIEKLLQTSREQAEMTDEQWNNMIDALMEDQEAINKLVRATNQAATQMDNATLALANQALANG